MHLITATYREDLSASFTEDGWVNATTVAERFRKRPIDWLRLDSTQDYAAALRRHLGQSEKFSLWRTRRGGKPEMRGTWIHPRLAVAFARWLDADFAIWCDLQIESVLSGAHPRTDWKRARHASSASNKVMASVLQLMRQERGKPTAAHHYANESRLVNWALTGAFTALDRDQLSEPELALLAKLEERNAVLIGLGFDYRDRKPLLERFAREQQTPAITQEPAP